MINLKELANDKIFLGAKLVKKIFLGSQIVFPSLSFLSQSLFNALVPKTATEIKFLYASNNPDLTDYQRIGYCDNNNLIEVWNSETKYIIINPRKNYIYAPANFSSFFYNYSVLEHVYFYNFNMSKVTNLNQSFQDCSNLLTLDFSNVKSLDNVTSLYHAFFHCYKLSGTLDLSLLNPENISTLQGTFNGCNSINIIKFSNKKFPSTALSMYWTFRFCYRLQTIFANSIHSISDEVFSDCYNLVGGNGTVYNGSHINAKYARVDGENGLPGYFTAPAAG